MYKLQSPWVAFLASCKRGRGSRAIQKQGPCFQGPSGRCGRGRCHEETSSRIASHNTILCASYTRSGFGTLTSCAGWWDWGSSRRPDCIMALSHWRYFSSSTKSDCCKGVSLDRWSVWFTWSRRLFRRLYLGSLERRRLLREEDACVNQVADSSKQCWRGHSVVRQIELGCSASRHHQGRFVGKMDHTATTLANAPRASAWLGSYEPSGPRSVV